MRKREPGRPLSAAELRQRREAAQHRHKAETSPSVRQGVTDAPSRAAVGLFRQGQQRPDTRARRGVWDTRTTEAPVGSINARFRLHVPDAYLVEDLDKPLLPAESGRPLLAEVLADQPTTTKGKRRIGGARHRVGREKPYRDLTIENPGEFVRAMRHPTTANILQRSIGVVRDHQKGTLERGKRMMPPGTPYGTAVRAYKHAALLALHRAGVGDYDFKMDTATKRELQPLVPFMRYAHRRVFDRLHTENPGAYEPFKEQFGTPFSEHRHGKLVGVPRYRMRPNEKFIKRSPVDDAADRALPPTPEQAEAGNYRMGHISVGGLAVSIETPKGSLRHGGPPGHRWSVRMPAHYGYIKRSTGADGDHVDVYLGPHAHQAEQHPVFIVDQQHADTHRFDEHKTMVGFRDRDHATRTYDAAFSDRRGPDRRRAVHQVSFEDFRHWVGNGETTKPFGGQVLRKDWTNSTGVIRSPGRGPTDQPWQRRRGDEDQAGNTAGVNGEEPVRRPIRHAAPHHHKIAGAAREALKHGHSVRLALNKPVPELPHGKPPPAHPAMHLRDAAKQVERHFGVSRETIGKIEGAAAPDPEMQKVSGTFMLGDPDPIPDFGAYNSNPAFELRRAMRPRVRRRRMGLRLGHRQLRQALSGGLTRQERWQFGVRPGGFSAQKAEGLDFTDALEKGVIGAAMKFGARMGPAITGAASRVKGAVGAGARTTAQAALRTGPGQAATRGAQRVAATPTGQRILSHPNVQAMGQEIKGLREGGFREGIGSNLGRIAGAGIGGARGARIGRNVGWAAEYAPWVGGAALGATHVMGIGHKKKVEKIAPRAMLGAVRAGASRLFAHPRVAAAINEIKDQPAPKTPLYRLGRIVGAAAGGERGARIGGITGHAIEVAPFAYAGAKMISNRRKRQEQLDRLKQLPGAGLVLGKALAGTAAGYGVRGIGRVLAGTARVAGKGIRKHPLLAGAAIGTAGIPAYHHLQRHPVHRAIAGAALGGTIAALATRGRAGPGALRASRKIYQQGLKDAVREHLRTLSGGGHSPHQVAQANAVFHASKRLALQRAKAMRAKSRRSVSATAVAGAAGVGGLAGLSMPSRSKWEDVPPY